MKPLSALLVAMFLTAFTPGPYPQASDVPTDRDAVFWASDGNSLLRNCDEASPGFPTGAVARQYLIYCDSWITGIRQGIELTESTDVDALRSKVKLTPPSPEVEKLEEANSKASLDLLKEVEKMGVTPVATPDADMCIPLSVPPDQSRLVVIKWLKDNPKQLGQPASLLAFAALRNTYPCPDGVTLRDWPVKH
jgi:hypothetical protein